MEETLKWYGWKDIKIPNFLIGDTIKKGSGIWEKEYTYILIPEGYGYDNYGFWLSDSLVHYNLKKDNWWFSVCHDMKLELVYSQEEREPGQKYKRYRMSGYDLVEHIFSDYTVNFAKECEEREKNEQQKKDLRNKKTMGSIVCGFYKGNSYSDQNAKYGSELTLKAYFYNGKAYSNNKFEKVQNVKKEFVIIENISKYEFLRMEDIINAYLDEYQFYHDLVEYTRSADGIKQASKAMRRLNPELYVKTGKTERYEKLVGFCSEAIEEIKKEMLQRIMVLKSNNEEKRI